MTSNRPFTPKIRPQRFWTKIAYKVWNLLTGVYTVGIIICIAIVLLANKVWRIGSPRRKFFRPLDPTKPLKIGIVSEYYYPHLGGVSEAVHYEAVELVKMGYDVKVITSHVAEPYDFRFSEHGFEILRVGRPIPIHSNGSLSKITVGWRIGRQIRKLIQKQKFDVLHIHSVMTPILPLLFQRYADCPVIGQLHALLKSKDIFYRLFPGTATRFMNDFEGRIAVSKVAATPFQKWFNCDFEVIPNGVPVDEFQTSYKKISPFDDGVVNLFFIGRMEHRNGISVLIDAFRIIHREDPNTRLILVGAGPLKTFFEDSVEDELKPHVHFVGSILKEEKSHYFATADINICPTTGVAASFGITLVESMASGKPTVCSDMPAFNETAEKGKDVLMAHPARPEEFAKQTLRLIREPALGIMLAKRALIKMQRTYGWPSVIERVDKYIHEVLEVVHHKSLIREKKSASDN